MRWLLILALACGACKDKRAEDAPRRPDHDAALPIDAALAIDAALPIAAADAAAPPATPAPADAPTDAAIDPRTEQTRTYVNLLAIDFWLYEILESFPGAPSNGIYVTIEYWWRGDDLLPPAVLDDQITRALQASARTPRTATDDAVHAYVAVLSDEVAKLLALRQYYAGKRFIDDDFDRARRETPDVARLRERLAALRPAMRDAVITAWQELSGGVADSPRAIITTAWRTCIAVTDALMAHAKRAAISAALSACRRSVASVAALPAAAGGDFADTLRTAAIEIGDGVANSLIARNLPGHASRLTEAYLALWPTLANTPAERSAP